jgi:hypothetical protein
MKADTPFCEQVEELPQSGQVLLLGGRANGMLAKVVADVAGPHPGQIQVLWLAPCKKPSQSVPVGGPCVAVGPSPGEEVMPGCLAGGAVPLNEQGQ